MMSEVFQHLFDDTLLLERVLPWTLQRGLLSSAEDMASTPCNRVPCTTLAFFLARASPVVHDVQASKAFASLLIFSYAKSQADEPQGSRGVYFCHGAMIIM